MKFLTQKWPVGSEPAALIGAAAAIAIMVGLLISVDRQVADHVAGWPEQFVTFLDAVTRLGKSDWILVPTFAFCLTFAGVRMFGPKNWFSDRVRHWNMLSLFIFVGVGLPGLVSNLLKRGIGRARPEIGEQGGTFFAQPFAFDYRFQAFPSGHTTTAFALAFVVGFLWPRFFWPFLILAVLIGISRVGTGAHYPSDVAGGVLVGTLGAFAVRNGFSRFGRLFEVDDSGSVRRATLTASVSQASER